MPKLNQDSQGLQDNQGAKIDSDVEEMFSDQDFKSFDSEGILNLNPQQENNQDDGEETRTQGDQEHQSAEDSTSEEKQGSEDVGEGSSNEGEGREETTETEDSEEEEPTEDSIIDKLTKELNPPEDKKFPDTRDYDEFDEDTQKVLKKMSNDSYAYTTKLIKEHKAAQEELKNLKEQNPQQSFYENPESFTLTPEGKKITEEYSANHALQSHYDQQLSLAQQGKPWVAIVPDGNGGFTQRTMSPAVQENEDGEQVHVPDPKHLNWLNQQIGQTQAHETQLKQTYAQLAAQHKEQSQTIQQFVTTQEERFFPALKELKGKDKEIFEGILNILPGSLKINPMSRMAAKGVITISKLSKQLKEAQKELNLLKAVKSDKKKGGPTITEVNEGNPTSPSEEDFRDEDFDGIPSI